MVWGRFKNRQRTPAFMDEVIVAYQVLFVLGLLGFGLWFSRLAFRLDAALGDIAASEEQLDEIKESIEIVAAILNKLPELMPQFTMNSNPLQPIFEAFAQKLSGAQPLMTYTNAGQGEDGKFNGTKTQSEEKWKTPSASNVESDAGA